MSACRTTLGILAILLATLVTSPTSSHATDASATTPLELLRAKGVYGQLNPEAPAETAQFSFLIGDWACTTRFMKQDGKSYREGTAEWIGVYVLNGYAIQDYWIGHGPQGKDYFGTNIRSYDQKKGKWMNRWLPAGTLQWSSFESEMKDGKMVMIGGGGTSPRGDFISRNTFYEIGPDSWRWRQDRSYDDGKTWFEGVGFIDAKRRE